MYIQGYIDVEGYIVLFKSMYIHRYIRVKTYFLFHLIGIIIIFQAFPFHRQQVQF
jgi:hypothetical protein